MHYLKAGALALGLLVIPGLSLEARMVSFLVVETGIPRGGAAEASSHWENGLMDIFFEAGHIVSNGAIKRIALEDADVLPREVQGDFDAAAAGGAEFFLLALLDYQGNANPSAPKPQQVVLRLFKTKPCRLVAERRYSGVPGAVAEELGAAKNAAQGIISSIK
ncbi:MAG: hypothetical protein LBD37_08720 [Treponema sp.]|jgi:hypothetical protein|nr:hypothetical protein [Treponema sp.]